MECMKDKNSVNCPCTFSCGNHGICCECVRHHNAKGQFPGCFFSKEAEKTGDRSFEMLMKDRGIK